jgi:hypothetical protein
MRMAESTDMQPFTCLRCGHEFDRCGGVGSDPGPAPVEGSISLCIRCGDVAFFVGLPLRLRPPTADERASMDRDPELRRIRASLAQAIAERPS